MRGKGKSLRNRIAPVRMGDTRSQQRSPCIGFLLAGVTQARITGSVNASAQGGRDLFPACLCGRMDLGIDPGLWAVPHFGPSVGLLLEAVIMLIAMIISACWVIRRFHLPQTPSATISMGLVTLGLLLPAEIAGVLWVRGLPLKEYLASFANTPGIISVMMFLLFAAMPTLVTLLTRGRIGAISTEKTRNRR